MTKRILVVEDQEDDRQIIRDMLAGTDYAITEAEDGEQALAAVAKERPPGSETGPGQLVTWGKSVVCSVDAFDYKFHWTTNSSKHIPFDWTGP
jgi:CheY-like chemotaxis protein